MVAPHAPATDLVLLATGLSDREARALTHALGCARCAAVLTKVLASTEERPAGPAHPTGTAEGGADYGAMWDRLTERLTVAAAEREAAAEEARRLLPALLALAPDEQLALVAAHPRYHTLPFVLVVLDLCAETAYGQPRRAEHLARLALAVGERLTPPAASAALRGELNCQGLALLGQALGLQQRWKPAEATFQAAARALPELASTEAAGWARLTGRLRRQQGRLAEALVFLGHAARLCDDLGAFLEEATILAEMAEVHTAAGEPERGLALLSRAALVGGDAAEPVTAVRHQVVVALLHTALGSHEWAEGFLAATEELARAKGIELPPSHGLARAFLAAQRGERAAGERLLETAWRTARRRGAWPEAALAAFHLAVVHAAAGRARQLDRLGEAIEPLLVPSRLPEPVRRVFVRLAGALARGQATLPDLLRLHRVLRRRLTLAREDFHDLMVLAEEPGLGLVDLAATPPPSAAGQVPDDGFDGKEN